MPNFQLLTAFVTLGGDQNNIVARGSDDPITFPEVAVLQGLHGGDDAVFGLIDIGEVERSSGEERTRLREKYGSIVDNLYAGADTMLRLPERDTSLPTAEEQLAAQTAATEAMAAKRASKTTSKAEVVPEPTTPERVPTTVAPLSALPGGK